MTDLSITILPETPGDAVAIERLHERTFGPGRFARTSFRIRERIAHRLDLSFTARIGTLLVGSVQLTPIRIGETAALLLGPLTVEPPFRERGVGQALIERALAAARQQDHRLVVLVGNEAYYAKAGFRRIP
jgi:predicted N-acetyltransferase YhbS